MPEKPSSFKRLNKEDAKEVLQERTPETVPEPKQEPEQKPEPTPQVQQEPIIPLPVPPEEFDHNEMFARRRIPRIYHGKGSASVVIADEKSYVITDLSCRSSRDENKVIWTQIYAVISPVSQLEPMIVDDGNIKYSVLGGNGSVTIENVSKPIERYHIFVVEKGVTHSIINTSKTDFLVILIDYSGTDILDLRELYKPLEQMTKKAQVTRERLMNVAPKKEKEEVVQKNSANTAVPKKSAEDLYV